MTFLHTPQAAPLCQPWQALLCYSSRTGSRLKSESRMSRKWLLHSLRFINECCQRHMARLFLFASLGVGFGEIGKKDIQHAVFVLVFHRPPRRDERIPGLALPR